MTVYERFEQIVALVLGALIAVVIVIALFQLVHRILFLVLGGALDLLDPEAFQALFGSIMTLLIAMEFRHSIIGVALRRQSIIQVKTVVLIAILALSRKFVILNIEATGPATIAALASATLVLGIVYWLLRERDDRIAHRDSAQGSGGRG
ncbi:MAG: phosphate-starvation-inducible PsiE family protein [Candidatus Binatia bacterium]